MVRVRLINPNINPYPQAGGYIYIDKKNNKTKKNAYPMSFCQGNCRSRTAIDKQADEAKSSRRS